MAKPRTAAKLSTATSEHLPREPHPAILALARALARRAAERDFRAANPDLDLEGINDASSDLRPLFDRAAE